MGMFPNRTKIKLEEDAVAIGTLSLLPEPALPELIGAAGFDFFVIDMEHVAVEGQRVANMIRACEAAQVTPIVRVRHVEEKEILWILDTGAQGLMIPLVEDLATIRRAYELSHYPPDGMRTLCSATRAAAHGVYRSDFAPYLEQSNRNMLLIGLIETPEAIDNIQAIASGPIDVLNIGRGDLSVKMGFPYAPRHPKVHEATCRALDAVIDRGKGCQHACLRS